MRVAVGMSGGVDSSVAAALLKQQGHDVFGVFLHFWSENIQGKSRDNICCSLESQEDARRVCRQLGIPLRVLNMERPFKKEIVDYFVSEYSAGRTPNPCIYCNRFIKFGEFLRKAKALGADAIATGHYAKAKVGHDGTVKLFNSKDKEKDQTYFLHQLTQTQLKQVMFPLGDYLKSEVRELAREFKLPVAEKRESQEICFVSDDDLAGFLKRQVKLETGNIIELETGAVLGKHQGVPLYTLGQRKGLLLAGGPWFVVDLDATKNFVYVSRAPEKLLSKEFFVKNINWLSGIEPKFPLKAKCRVRYRAKEISCVVAKLGKHYSVKLSRFERAIAPGQFCVFGKGKECLGGGVIDKKS